MGKGKPLNPADAFRKEQKKKDAKRNAKVKANIREVNNLLNNPQKIQEEIDKVQKESDENRLDKGIKDRIKELKRMKEVSMKKQQCREALSGGGARVNSSVEASTHAGHSGRGAPSAPPPKRPEDSVYYHPQFNPTGAAPPGQPMMYKTQGAPPVPSPAAGPPGSRPVYMSPPQQMHPPPRAWPRAAVPPGPPGPPRSQPVIGGLNGVPLPPPRPMGGAMAPMRAPSTPLYGPGPAAGPAPPPPPPRRQHAAHRQVADPLDPSAASYNARSDAPSHRPLPSHAINAPPPIVEAPTAQPLGPMAGPPSAPVDEPAGPSQPPHAVAEEPEPTPLTAEELMRSRHIMPDEEKTQYESEGEDEDGSADPLPRGPEPAPLSSEEILRRRFVMPDEDGNGNAPPEANDTLPSIEEIMRRRNQVIDDDNAECVGPSFPPPEFTGPSFPGSEADGVGPQGPPANYYPSAEEIYGVAPPVIESLADINPVNSAPSENVQKTSALQLFSAYGDSDDEDSDDSSDQAGHTISTPSVFFSSSGTTVPHEDNYDPRDVPMTDQSNIGRRETTVDTYYAESIDNRQAYDSNIVHSVAEISAPAPPAPKPLLGPKIVKVDSELTGFVPAAIRVKRQMANNTKGPVPKKLKSVPRDASTEQLESKATWIAPSTVSTTTNVSVVSGPPTSVDDEYSDFMKEIESLNSL